MIELHQHSKSLLYIFQMVINTFTISDGEMQPIGSGLYLGYTFFYISFTLNNTYITIFQQYMDYIKASCMWKRLWMQPLGCGKTFVKYSQLAQLSDQCVNLTSPAKILVALQQQSENELGFLVVQLGKLIRSFYRPHGN